MNIFTFIKKLLRDRISLVGLILVFFMFMVALWAPQLAPHNPTAINPAIRLSPPSIDYLFGTDELGRCILSRVIHGARLSLMLSVAVVFTLLSIGVPIGLIAGFFGGIFEDILMRFIDIVLAFPQILLAIAITGFLGPGLFNLFIAMASFYWVSYARIVRGMVVSVKEQEYVESARALGVPNSLIMIRHILPNVISPVIVLATLDLGKIILFISGLSFLGLGAQPPTPEWGVMLNDARSYFQHAPHMIIFPGLGIVISIFGFNLLGDGLRDVLDPKDIAGSK